MIDVIILAGGLGTRLRSVINSIPKCMAPVKENPFIYYLLSYLNKYDIIENVILSLGYKHQEVSKWIEKECKFSFNFVYSIEYEPLGTGGAIKKALSLAHNNQVLIINGDTYFDIDLFHFLNQHNIANSDLSIALKAMTKFNRYGNIQIDKSNKIIRFNEKKYCEQGYINGGIYLINMHKIDFSFQPSKFSFEKGILQTEYLKNNMYGFVYDNYFIDIGIPEDYAKANIDFNKI
jgi:D-glycero-alpha-D-manno-heptose 1-phosphate guanylyltransferase